MFMLMRYFSFGLLLASALLLSACGIGQNGHYVPVSAANALFLVDTQTGKMYNVPSQYHEGTDPKANVPAKWKLAAEF